MWYKMKVPKNLIFMLMKPNLLKGNGKKIFCFVYMYSQRMYYNWMYDITTCIIIHSSMLIKIS